MSRISHPLLGALKRRYWFLRSRRSRARARALKLSTIDRSLLRRASYRVTAECEIWEDLACVRFGENEINYLLRVGGDGRPAHRWPPVFANERTPDTLTILYTYLRSTLGRQGSQGGSDGGRPYNTSRKPRAARSILQWSHWVLCLSGY